jgi:hypothetical protein
MKHQKQKIKGFSRPATVAPLNDGSWVVLAVVNKPRGAVARVYHTDRDPTTHRPRPYDIKWEFEGDHIKEAERFFEYLAEKKY